MAELADQHGLTFRQDYFADPAAFRALATLLHDTFSIDISLQSAFCGPDPSSMPFGYFDADGRCVANFSVFSMPLVIKGRKVKAAGYQSGAVRPEWRRRGFYRDLMQRAFAYARADGYELDILLTDKPALYERYGFRTIPQHVFVGPPPVPAMTGLTAKRLSLQGAADLDVMKRVLLTRAPVSRRFAVAGQMEMFHLNACFDAGIRLTLVDEKTIVAWKYEGATVRLLDIAAATIPPLGEILATLEIQPQRVEVCFPTDRLGWTGTPEPYQGYCALMVRGDAAGFIDGPIMLSPMAEF
ncbi:MAG: GNAT family N-acetyltransferase [Rhizobiaceae bacterium]|nr:GNAT family N-acetyltransferase [Rhizobiaceae bacterium]